MSDHPRISPHRPRILFRSGEKMALNDARGRQTYDFLDLVVQRSLRDSMLQRSEGANRLASQIFVQNLAKEMQSQPFPDELTILARPLTFLDLRLRDREFVSVNHAPPEDEMERSPGLSREDIRRILTRLQAATTSLAETPSGMELMATVFEHCSQNVEVVPDAITGRTDRQFEGIPFAAKHEVHDSRRAALRNWQHRYEQATYAAYEHNASQSSLVAFPVVDLLQIDNDFVLLFFVSPLDENFIDEKVDVSQRVGEITVGVYDIQRYHGKFSRELAPRIRNAFARVLFTNTTQMNGEALRASFGEQGAISRHWISHASMGLKGLLELEEARGAFDSMSFCEAIVERVLCAKVKGVSDTEIYPFDRAYIFREAGVRGAGQMSNRDASQGLEPIEMLVLEASVLSKNPRDRGQFLTRRQRLIRKTRDHECDASEKRIKDEHILRFYIHDYDEGLILSRKLELSESDKERIFAGERSRKQSEADNNGYKIGRPQPNTKGGVSTALYNLLGRLIPEATREDHYEMPGPERDRVPMQKFTEEFERGRLQILRRFSQEGLYFEYSHGMDFEDETPILHQLQRAYKQYLDDKFQDEDEQYFQEQLESLNLDEQSIKRLLEDRSNEKTLQIRGGASDEGDLEDEQEKRQRRSKVVYISFSPQLHEENVRGTSNVRSGQQQLLSDDYTFTLILVSDEDSEKSQAQLHAERNDLRLYFEVLLRQIWLETLQEHQYLRKKSQSIEACMTQFDHRAKSLITFVEKGNMTKEEAHTEMDSLFDMLKKVVNDAKSTVRSFSSTEELFLALTDLGDGSAEERLRARVERWFPGEFGPEPNGPKHHLELIPSHMPTLDLVWSDAVLIDAFYVALKNACEAVRSGERRGFVSVQLQAVPKAVEQISAIQGRKEWFLDIIIGNSGGPIDRDTLSRLNAPDPVTIQQNTNKDTSMGVGVFLSRTQLREVIRGGADMLILNAEQDSVVTRIRIPGTSKLEESAPTVEKPGLPPPQSLGDYLLYVEDDKAYYEPGERRLQQLLHGTGMALHHARSYESGSTFLRRKLPRIMVTDFHIPERDLGGEPAAPRWGLSLLDEICELGTNAGELPPVWLLSNEENVRQHLGHLAEFYQFLTPDSSADELLTPGSICIFQGEKQVNDQMASILSGIRTGGQAKRMASTVDHRIVDLKSSTIADGIVKVVEQNNSSRPILLLVDHVRTIEQLVGRLAEWFAHDGIPDLDPSRLKRLHQFELHNNLRHNRLVLSLLIAEDVFAKIQPRLMYWALINNIYLAPARCDVHAIADRWSTMRNDGNGPLSNLRHDLKNKWSHNRSPEILDPVLQSAIKLENQLKVPTDVGEKLAAKLQSQKVKPESQVRVVSTLLNDEDAIGRQRLELRRGLQRLANEVQGLNEKNMSPDKMEPERILKPLADYIGGTS